MLKTRYNINCSTCLVNHLCLINQLDEEVVKDVNENILYLKHIEKGNHVFHVGDKMENLYAVHSGSCRDYWIDSQGNERINNFYFSGDIIGLESIPDKKHRFSLVALEDLQVCLIPLENLYLLMQKHRELLIRMFNICSFKMKNDHESKLTTNAKQRVIGFLLNIFQRLNERNQYHEDIPLAMSQLEISNFLGIAHETVNRILREIRQNKIIKIQDKKIFIINPTALKEMDDFNIAIGQN